MTKEQKLKEIFTLPFIKAIKKIGGGVYIVGGAIRDFLRNQDPKDIDLIVSRVPYQQLISLLKNYGTVKVVGEAFGVILFKTEGFEGEIALPRVDSKDKSLKGHKSIIAQSDPNIPIEKDLARRDFTMNAIAMYVDNNGAIKFIDPFDGVSAIKNNIVDQVDSEAFADDPLRLLRAIQFAARFNFRMTQNTMQTITDNAFLIKEITSERILMEFQKVIDKKGDLKTFVSLMSATTVFQEIFGFKFRGTYNSFEVFKPKTIGELLFMCCTNSLVWTPDFCKRKLKIDNNTEKELRALELVFAEGDKVDKKWNLFGALKIYPNIINSSLITANPFSKDFISGKYPKSQKELNISGTKLMELGLVAEQITEAYKNMLNAIFTDKVDFKNTPELLKLI